MAIKLASYNVHKCVGLDRRRRPDRVLAVMSRLHADVLALQEVDFRLGPRPAALSRELSERATGLVALPYALNQHSFGWHGQTILVRRDFGITDVHRLELPGLEPRGALLAELTSDDGPFRILAAHLGLLARSRKMQFAAIRAALSRRTQMPTILIGDYNEWSSRGGSAALGPEFHTHTPGPSFPAARPVARLDRISLGFGAHLTDAGTYDSNASRVASDHLPIWANISLRPRQAF